MWYLCCLAIYTPARHRVRILKERSGRLDEPKGAGTYIYERKPSESATKLRRELVAQVAQTCPLHIAQVRSHSTGNFGTCWEHSRSKNEEYFNTSLFIASKQSINTYCQVWYVNTNLSEEPFMSRTYKLRKEPQKWKTKNLNIENMFYQPTGLSGMILKL